ncbi:hydroxymethylglutaryl-CoA lyase [Pseudomonas fluorescens]|uniref:hydroxymethylglutaryl-CoA lyase n=1 Tax=Pseudomonas fluorescens TaxID=294 RepID=UPI00177F12B3|nr:hydroxymethylglutaryl-CoA lyase [Pseudomonas fluorescens]MDF2794302.1 3-hydroxy-3-methylglutaryl-CoA lyase [Pseudomonas orientalis]MBD8150466.1 hydroxymethylglutaryl-CoA lyase [Pseudomonas fluorescens]MBD8178320.1 hydroxymethylglutaryl-CoA lyase [Pseudomonas fluorescens]MBD8747595.1 hydroxymethylglutaryl-CoA lyase [Pseudomonas fluorescens]MBD8752178.1 hydroxymethylglutaryl-CoA lyase [Pseudomonas fluorescens]
MTTITINEVGLRDGLQSLKATMPTSAKRQWIDAAYAAGVRYMEVASFVPAKLLPQMADAKEVVAHALSFPDLVVTVLAPNLRGCRDALESGAHRIIAPVSVSAAHSLANVRRTPLEMVQELAQMCQLRTESGLHTVQVIAGMSVAFGCTRQGDVPLSDLCALTGHVLQAGCDLVSLGDTTGYANPGQVATTLQAVRAIAGDKLRAAHFHDTRGLALANSLVAVQQGITELDSSLAGLGGCPFAPGASGNTVTEDLVFMLQSMGCETGIDLAALIDSRHVLSEALPHETLYGCIARAGLPLNYASIVGRV